MRTIISQTPEELGRRAAKHAAEILRQAVDQNGSARLLLSTGASQFNTLDVLVEEPVDWQKVELFHLDEYIGLHPNHSASFIKYLQERFVSKVMPKRIYFVDTSGNLDELLADLTRRINESLIDVGLIGIGENAHIAFNDPPADFDDESAYKIVTLVESCRRQQLGEGWFHTLEEVPTRAVTMTVRQILKCRHIISAVPYQVKAQAVHDMLTAPAVTPRVPATALKNHCDATLYLDLDSASMIGHSSQVK